MKPAQDFWSRRKQAVEEEASEQIAFEERKSLEEFEQQSDEEILQELGLQNPDEMEKGDDFSAFMSKAVPARLRNKALRKLWLSDPTLANLDSLVDYGEDFTDSAMAVENIQTAYQVGKGMLSHVMKMAELAEKEDEAQEISPEDEIDGGADLAMLEDADDEAINEIEDQYIPEKITEEISEADIMFAPKKRMRFVIEAQV